MSLVNDALKQAQQTRPKLAPQADGPAMRPVESARRPSGGRSLMLPALIAVALLVGGASLWEWVDSGRAALKVRANSNSQVTAQPVAEPVEIQPAPVPAPEPKPSPVLSSALPAKSDNLPPAAESASNAVAAVAVEPPKAQPPVYKLQGIFYMPKRSLRRSSTERRSLWAAMWVMPRCWRSPKTRRRL